VSPAGLASGKGNPGNYPPYTAEGKAEMVKGLYDENCVLHSLLVCDMPAKFIPLSLDDFSQYFHAATGETFSRDDFLKVANRIETLIRMFNNREGFTRRDDTLLTGRSMSLLLDGPAKGQHIGEENLNRMINEYYELRGWDPAGVPTKESLLKYEL